MTDLQTAAQQALEALSEVDNCTYINDYGDAALDTAYESGMVYKAIAALRAALAQQDPEFLVTNCTLWGSPPKPHEYWSEFFSAMVETRTLAGVFISDAALAQQDEPVDVGLLEYRGNSVAFIHQKMTAYRAGIDAAWDAFRAKGLHPDGKTPLANMIAKYTAPPQRKPLTEEELGQRYYVSTGQMLREQDKRLAFLFARAIEQAHGIREQP